MVSLVPAGHFREGTLGPIPPCGLGHPTTDCTVQKKFKSGNLVSPVMIRTWSRLERAAAGLESFGTHVRWQLSLAFSMILAGVLNMTQVRVSSTYTPNPTRRWAK